MIRSAAFGQALCKIVGAAAHGSKADVSRCVDTLARSLTRDGDQALADALRAILVEKPIPRWKTLAGSVEGAPVEWYAPGPTGLVLDEATGARLRRLSVELAQAPRFVVMGVDAPTRVLFAGPSGAGKTLAARWLGEQLGLPVALIRLERTVDSLLGATAKNVGLAFDAAATCPSILFLDEVDAVCGVRGSTVASAAERESSRTTSSLFQQLDSAPPGQIVIAATNFLDLVDPALRRRMTTEVRFGLPTEGARRAMVAQWLAQVPHAELAFDVAVERSIGMSGASLRGLVMAAARLAILAEETLTGRHVDEAARLINFDGQR